MKASKLANILFISAFLTFIFVIMVVTIAKPKLKVSYYENRELAQQPELDARAMLDSSYFYRWERFFADQAAGRATLVRLGTLIDLEVIKRPVVNEVIRSGGIYLGFNEFESVDPVLIRSQSKEIVGELSALNEVITSYGGVLYYVTVPSHYSWYADKYPWYLNNRKEYTEASLEAFTSDMYDAGIGLIEMKEILAGIEEPPPLFFSSDHHFTFRGAYETYRAIINRVNGDGKYDLPLLDGKDLSFLPLENPFLGSRLRKILGIPGITERTEIAIPHEEIPFTRTDRGKTWEVPSVYSLPQNGWDVIDYHIYMNGDISETVIDTGRQLPSVLIYGDSYTNAVECLMYLSCGVMRSVDLRDYKDMSLAEYVETYKPDIVVGIRGYEVLLEMTGNGVLMS